MKFRKLLLTAFAALTSLAAMADDDFCAHRYDAMKACKLTEQSVVFIGNSITNMGNWHEQFGSNSLVVNRGNSGARSFEALENLETILVGKPAKIFVMIGTNDIGSSTGTPQTVAANGRALIERVKAESPNTRVHIISTFPSSNGARTPENHAEINRLLKEVCAETETPFIDLWNDMQGILTNAISADHLHITAQGYYIWTNRVLPYLGEGFVSTMPSNSEANNSYNWTNGNGLRVNMLFSMPILADDILMVGGEMLNNGEWHELLHNSNIKNRAATYGYGDYLSGNWVNYIEPMFDLNKSIKTCPKQIYINIGSQDINTNVALETLEANYKSIVEKFIAKAPAAKINLVALTPHTDATKNANTKTFNAWLEALATEKGLTYVDIFTPCAKADGTPNPQFISTTLNAPYATARGYLTIARTLAPFIGDCTVEDEAEFEARYELINARQELGNIISATYTAPMGSTMGTYSEANRAEYEAIRAEAYAVINDPAATPAEIRTKAAELKPRIDAPKALNQPVDGQYYTITALRMNRTLMQSSNTSAASALPADTDKSNHAMQWQLVKRADGSWDIKNREYNTYIIPTAPMVPSTTAPATGWTIVDHATTGTYAVVSGGNQLHQANGGNSWNLLNWGSGNNLTDEGCAFWFNEVVDAEEGPANTGILTTPEDFNERGLTYEITAKGSYRLEEGATGGWVLTGGGNGEWRLIKRTDGLWDFQNVATGNYIDPDHRTQIGANQQFVAVATSPTNGWTIEKVTGQEYYIIYSDANHVQMNVWTANSNRFINWGYGAKVTGQYVTTEDEGCRFTFAATYNPDAVYPASIELPAEAIEIEVGQSTKVIATVLPDDTSDKTVTWEVADPSIAVIDCNGLLLANKIGTTTATASCGKVSATMTINVVEHQEPVVIVPEITLSAESLTLEEGTTATIEATVTPEGEPIEWISSNEEVATVADGVITAIAPGTAIITASVGDVSASCTITVTAKPQDPEDGLNELSTINYQPSTVYDLQGRKVTKPNNGLYIINGQKVIK